jgi:hypothetical protein
MLKLTVSQELGLASFRNQLGHLTQQGNLPLDGNPTRLKITGEVIARATAPVPGGYFPGGNEQGPMGLGHSVPIGPLGGRARACYSLESSAGLAFSVSLRRLIIRSCCRTARTISASVTRGQMITKIQTFIAL